MAIVKGDELAKYIAQKVIHYIDMPREERLEARRDRRGDRQPWKVRWFGMIPLALSMWFNGRKKRRTPDSISE